jgi:hypothetical protein
MGSLGTTPSVVLLLAVGVAAALCGYIASAVARRNKRRTRGVFLVGLFCGFTAGVVVRRRWRDIGRLAVRALNASALPTRLGLVPPQRPRRLPVSLLTVRR